VLELGCASGGNLIPMGLSWPHSRFLGIDLSARQIRDGWQIVRELELANVDLQCQSILDFSREQGMFDYILCHGVYSWVPAEVQNKIIEICRDHLNPQGIAYVSYNTFPGWHARAAIREMLCYHTEQFDDPTVRIREARGLLALLLRAAGNHEAAFNSLIRHEMAVLAATPDTYLLHEHLEDYNEPLYFHQFVDRAGEKNLQYLGEAQLATMLPGRFGSEIEQTLRSISHDLIQMEQYIDFLRNRTFRQTLLCHDDVALDYNLRPEVVEKSWLASSARPLSAQPNFESDDEEQFQTPGGGERLLSTRDPLLKGAMSELARIWPQSLAFADLLQAAAGGRTVQAHESRELAARLLRCYTAGIVELSLGPPRLVAHVSERPIASPYARRQAREGGKVVNMRLESTVLEEPARIVLQNLDGFHNRATLVELVQDWLERNESSERASPEASRRAQERVDQLLESFARSALLIA
jgi:methyltransferase-like protein